MANVLIAMPCYGGQVHVECAKAVMNLREVLSNKGIRSEWFTLTSESLITRARNACVAYFLAKEFTHLLFIDSDIVFDANSVLRLLDKNKDISGCVYPMKKVDTSDVCNRALDMLDWNKIKEDISNGRDTNEVKEEAKKSLNHDKIHAKSLNYVVSADNTAVYEQGWLRVRECGTGFLMIKRNVFEDMMTKFPYLKYKNDGAQYDAMAPNMKDFFYLFFDCRCIDGRYLSEDYAFCRLVRDIGYEIWVDTTACLTHIGRTAYKGNLLLKLSNI